MIVMKKVLIGLSSIFVLLITFSVFALQEDNCRIKLGNEILTMKYPIIMQNDRVYVSLRDICNKLSIPISWNDAENEAYADIYNKKIPTSKKTEYKDDGVIPDAETAYQIGKIILEKYINQPVEYETENVSYKLETKFLEAENAWRVYQQLTIKKGYTIGIRPGTTIDNVEIKLNRNTGEVLYLSTYGTFSNLK